MMTTSDEKHKMTMVWVLQKDRMQFWKERGFAPKTALDVGACLGEWTTTVESVWPECRVTQVEADLRCEPGLRAAGHELFMVPLAQTAGMRPFYTSKHNDLNHVGNSSLYLEVTKNFKLDYATVDRHCETLDALFKGRTFDLIKLDTQGSELDILRGGRDLLTRTSFVQLEVSLVEYNHGAPMFTEMVRALNDEFGFQAVDVFQVHYLTDLEKPGSQPYCVQVDLLFGRDIT